MPKINDLPVEVLGHILSFFVAGGLPQWDCWEQARIETKEKTNDPDSDDKKNECTYGTLYNACLVSKKFRAIAQPLLLLDFVDHGLLHSKEHLIRFAKCLYRYPELGQLVQYISIEGNLNQSPSEYDSFINLSDGDAEFFLQASEDLKPSNMEESWFPAKKSFDYITVVALIVNKTPNIRRLVLPGGLEGMDCFSLSHKNNDSFLSKLEAVWIRKKLMWIYDIASYYDFLTLHHLKTAVFESCCSVQQSAPYTLEPGRLSIEKLVFRDCGIDNLSLQSLTHACRELKSFSFDNFKGKSSYEYNLDDTWKVQFNAVDACEALTAHKDTLENLRLNFARNFINPNDWQQFLSNSVTIPSLHDFSVLRDICLDQAIVPEHPQFPPTLTRLTILDCNSSVISLVTNIANDCKMGLYAEFVDFRILAVDVRQPISGISIPTNQTQEQAEQTLADLFIGTKVDFRILESQIFMVEAPFMGKIGDPRGYYNGYGNFYANHDECTLLVLLSQPSEWQEDSQSPSSLGSDNSDEEGSYNSDEEGSDNSDEERSDN